MLVCIIHGTVFLCARNYECVGSNQPIFFSPFAFSLVYKVWLYCIQISQDSFLSLSLLCMLKLKHVNYNSVHWTFSLFLSFLWSAFISQDQFLPPDLDAPGSCPTRQQGFSIFLSSGYRCVLLGGWGDINLLVLGTWFKLAIVLSRPLLSTIVANPCVVLQKRDALGSWMFWKHLARKHH